MSLTSSLDPTVLNHHSSNESRFLTVVVAACCWFRNPVSEKVDMENLIFFAEGFDILVVAHPSGTSEHQDYYVFL